ncbi:disintegrin and metalloproteinase domain-containing protein 10 homolog [Pollicipes pollicipes]|nr:disintegrin and metalloproteinase domain-containing protein 10 homolog [Pollicipes pollicipes]
MSIVEWITHYWWAVLLISVAFVVVMALFIRCCAVHTPSSNPKRAPPRKFADTLKHPMDTLKRQRRQHPRRPPGGGGPVVEESELAASSARPSRASHGPPPPYQQVGPSRHGYGAGRGHYSRQGTREDVEAGGRAAERQKRRSQPAAAGRHV